MMKARTFKKGLHPYDGKALSKDAPIRAISPGKTLYYPLSQHIGAPASPVVEIGQRVLKGETLAKGSSFVSADIISSVSGTVKAISPVPTVFGETADAVVVENDGLYETLPGIGEAIDPETLSREEILRIVREAGIVGLGGAGFPTHVKLSPKDPDAIETVIVNGAECEPYLTSDYRLMLERPEALLGGLKVILRLFPKARGVIGIEDNKPDAIRLLSEKAGAEEKISVCPLKTKYPQGGERTLIHAVTGRDICSKMLPSDVGCIVDNVATVIAVYDAVCRSTPLMSSIVTVTGAAAESPCNLEVPLGMLHSEVLAAAGGFRSQPEKIISGGPMMGTALFNLDVPVVKTSSAILGLVTDEVAKLEPSACIRCGRCVSVCPENLVPQLLFDAADHEEFERFASLGGMECVECGCCTYTCPAKRPLTQSFKYGKRMVAALRKKAKAGEEKK